MRDRLKSFVEKTMEGWGFVKRAAVALSTSGVFGYREYPNPKSSDMLASFAGWVFACVKARSRDTSRIQLKLYRTTDRTKDEAEEVTEHDVLSLLRSVNPFMTFMQLIEYTQAYKDLTGEAFWWLVKAGNRPNSMITQIWMLRPDYVNVKTSATGFIEGYEFTIPGQNPVQFRVDEILHFKEFNPLNPYRGLGVVKAAAITIDSDYYAEEYNKKFFRNSAVPEIVLSTEQKLTDTQVKRMHSEWAAKYQGTNNSHKTAILEGGLDVKPFSMSQKDMEFLSGMGFSRDKIFALFEVPKSRLGMTEGVTVSNAEATINIYLKYLVKPLMESLRDVLNEFLLPMYDPSGDLFFEIEDPVPQDVDAQMRRLQAEFAMGAITPNEVREEGGRDPVPGLDSHYLVLSQTPIAGEAKDDLDAERAAMLEDQQEQGATPVTDESGKRVTSRTQKRNTRVRAPAQMLKHRVGSRIAAQITEDVTKAIMQKSHLIQKLLPAPAEVAETKQELGKNEWAPERKSYFWKSLVAKTDRFETKYKSTVVDILDAQERKVLDALHTAEHKSAEQKILQSDVESIIISVAEENKASAEFIVPLVREILEEVGNDVIDFLAEDLPPFDAHTEALNDFMRRDAMRGIRVMNKVTKSKLRKALTQAIADGVGPVEAGRKIREVFTEAKAVRALKIARTETLKAANRGTLEAYKQSRVVVAKEWLTAEDEATCEFCGPMNGKVIGLDLNFFEKGETYMGKEGGIMTLDYDETATPPLHPNCRCTLIPVTISQRMAPEPVKKSPPTQEEIDEMIEARAKELAEPMAQEKAEKILENILSDEK